MLIFFSSCKKKEDKDTTSPIISISSPGGAQTYNMFDTITVVAHVSDETKLTAVFVSLNNSDNIGVQNDVSVAIQSKDFTFTVKYVLTEYHLASGFYNISVTANDGSNSHQSTAQVYINESPTLRTGYYVVGATQPKSIARYDAAFNPVAGTISLNTGFNGMAYGGYYKQLFVNGNINQSYQTYNTGLNNITWAMNYGGGGLPQYMGVYSDGKQPYVSFYTGNVVSYSSSGVIDRTYKNNSTNYYATTFAFGTGYNIGIYKEKFNAAGDKIISFGKNTGIAQNSNLTPCNVLAVFERTGDEFYVLGNDASNNFVFYMYTVSTNLFAGPFALPGGKLLSAVQIDSDYLVYSTSNGTIYGHRYSNGTTLALASVMAQKMIYKNKLNELTAAVKNSLYVYSVSGNYTLTQQNMQLFTDSIIGFEVLTNK